MSCKDSNRSAELPGTLSEGQHLDSIEVFIEAISQTLVSFENAVDKPEFTTIPDGSGARHFRYKSPGPRIIQYLLLVRIISGCRATLILLRQGHVAEAAVLLRTIDDFIGDFVLVEEALRSLTGPNAIQQKFFDNYFLESMDPTKQPVTRRQKVQAAEGRLLNPDNPCDVVVLSRKIDQLYDAAVHGDYSTAMDLYVSNSDGSDGRFEVMGVKSDGAITVHRLNLAFAVHRACAIALELSIGLRLRNACERLYRILRKINDEVDFTIPGAEQPSTS